MGGIIIATPELVRRLEIAYVAAIERWRKTRSPAHWRQVEAARDDLNRLRYRVERDGVEQLVSLPVSLPEE